jgi:hypothetical protein
MQGKDNVPNRYGIVPDDYCLAKRQNRLIELGFSVVEIIPVLLRQRIKVFYISQLFDSDDVFGDG